MPKLVEYYKGKKAVITGGSSGIGLAIAQQLCDMGASVSILARRPDVLEKARTDILSKCKDTQSIFTYQADVADPVSVNDAFEKVFTQSGIPDILINSAGITHPGEFSELPSQIFRSMMEVNYFGTLYAIQAVLPGMIERGSGSIANISSGVGFMNLYGYTAYGASKYAVSGLSDALRMELGPKGIRVSLIIPPDTDTPQLAYEKDLKPEATKILASIGGLSKPEFVAQEILNGIARNKYIIVPGFQNTVLFGILNFGRSLLYSIMDRMIKGVAH